ncbi:MAG: 16S rRNA (guanine(966)-N(2))-methyltransferase RsmD [Sphaerochaetaceae bacterium]|nr:16S rRNA (guanine(966)-N(2))-methyltransferase RsmD [Sphaerochaetaceae bacterium]
MRVVGGEFRSRRIKEVDSKKTRPTTDRNKETLFNILGQYFNGEVFLDLFAGSGALGIEAISRGAGQVDFIDSQLLACKTIKANLKSLNISKGYQIQKQDAFIYLNTTTSTYDFIIVDPPYALNKYQEILKLIVTRQLLNNGGIIVFEADKQTNLPESNSNIYKYKERVAGNTKFGFYKMEESI